MNIEEKLKHFLESSIESATNQSTQLIEDYTSALEKIFEDHKTDMARQAELQIRLGKDSLERNMNRELSKKQTDIRRNISKRQTRLKDMLFVEVKDLLEEYMDTGAYQELLVRQINEAAAFAGRDEIIIYIDPADSSKRTSLQAATGTQLTVSEYGFMGGIRAVIQSRNILIDNSFETQLKEAKEAFTFINKQNTVNKKEQLL